MTVCFYGYRIFWESEIEEKMEAALAELLPQDEEFRFYFYGYDILNWIAYETVSRLQQEHPEKKITMVQVTGPRKDDLGLLAPESFDEIVQLPGFKWYQKTDERRRVALAWLVANSDVALCHRYDDFYEEGERKPEHIPVGLRGVRIELTLEESYQDMRNDIARMPKPLRDVFVRYQACVPMPEIARELKISRARLWARKKLVQAYLSMRRAQKRAKERWQPPESPG